MAVYCFLEILDFHGAWGGFGGNPWTRYREKSRCDGPNRPVPRESHQHVSGRGIKHCLRNQGTAGAVEQLRVLPGRSESWWVPVGGA